MKKFTALAAVLLLLILAGCGPSGANVPDPPEMPSVSQTPDVLQPPEVPVPPSALPTSKIDRIPFDEDQLYAVACLGCEGPDGLSAYAEQYLDSENLPVHNISGGEYYLIIPRYPDMTMRLYRNSMEPAEKTLMYESAESEPFMVRCNVSDIFPDVTIQLTYQSETVEFSPYISLKDGNVEVGDRGYDLTTYA